MRYNACICVEISCFSLIAIAIECTRAPSPRRFWVAQWNMKQCAGIYCFLLRAQFWLIRSRCSIWCSWVPVAHSRGNWSLSDNAAQAFRYLVKYALSITQRYSNAIRLLLFQGLMENSHFFQQHLHTPKRSSTRGILRCGRRPCISRKWPVRLLGSSFMGSMLFRAP